MSHFTLRSFIRSSLLEMSTRYKRETGENFPRWQEKLKKYEDEGGLYVHFGSVPKLGINPQNQFNTPTGIYAYPMNSKYIDDFATDNPYIFILRINDMSSMLVLEDYTESDLNADLDKLAEMYPNHESKIEDARMSSTTPGQTIWETINKITDQDSEGQTGKEHLNKRVNPAALDPNNSQSSSNILQRAALHSFMKQQGDKTRAIRALSAMPEDEVFSKFASEGETSRYARDTRGKRAFLAAFKKRMIQSISALSMSDRDMNRQKRGESYVSNSVSTEKSKIFRALGYAGVIDGYETQGAGIIHPNEATQAVFFTTSAVSVQEMIEKEPQLKAIHWQGKRLVTPPKSGGNYAGQEIKNQTLEFEAYVHANLKGSAFRNSQIKRCDFSGANMAGTIMYRNSVEECLFAGTNLKGALISTDFDTSDFKGANMSQIKLSDSSLEGCEFVGADLSGGRLSHLKLNSADFSDTNLTQTRFEDTDFQFTQFNGSTLDGTKFEFCKLSDTSFEGLTLINVNLMSCDLSGVNLSQCTLEGVTLSGDLRWCDLSHSTWKGVRLYPQNGDLSSINMDGVTLMGKNWVSPPGTRMPPGWRADGSGLIVEE